MNFRALSLLFPLLLLGCAAVPTVEQAQPVSADLTRFKSVQVVVDGTDKIRQTAGFENASVALREEFAANLRSSGRFTQVSTEPRPGSLVAKLVITDLNYVHGATRGFTGVFAGRAVLNVTMSLSDSSTGAGLGELRAAHSSSHGQGVFSPVTSTQVTAIAKEFAGKLSGR